MEIATKNEVWRLVEDLDEPLLASSAPATALAGHREHFKEELKW